MTQLLVSVKNVAEALMADRAGADVIDLKDPANGALGALKPFEIKQIVQNLRAQNPHACISATIGDMHENAAAICDAIASTAELGVDIVKFALNGHAHDLTSIFGILKPLSKALSLQRVQLFGVLFADVALDFACIQHCAEAGLAGVMLDTQDKSQTLLQHAQPDQLLNFVNRCQQYELKSALAGSLQVQYIDNLRILNSTYMGFRGGLCFNQHRISDIDEKQLKNAKKLLHKGDINAKIVNENSTSTLNT